MSKRKSDLFYNAFIQKDKNYDGRVFIAVKNAGKYCRPICPETHEQKNLEYYSSSLLAEKNGYQPCLKCSPENAPQSSLNFSSSSIVILAIQLIEEHLDGWHDAQKIADLCGMPLVKLDELLLQEVGIVTEKLIEKSRHNFARKLISETKLSLSEVMLACGFSTVDELKELYKKRFKRYPLELKKKSATTNSIVLSIPYLKPYDFKWMLNSYRNHRIGNLEWFEADSMFRLIDFDNKIGTITISNDDANSQLLLAIDFPDVRFYKNIFNRVKKMFDVACDPNMLEAVFKKDKLLRKIFKKHPGIRIATGWDPFEISIATILGQLVSVERGQTLLNDLIELLGEPVSINYQNKIVKKFPSPEKIAAADLTFLKTTGIRKKTLAEFSKAYLSGDIHFSFNQEIESFKAKMLKIFGVGLWTANYVALKALKHLDAFPDSDLLLARAVKLFPEGTFNQMQPIRGYVAMLLWREYAAVLSKKKTTK